MHLGYEVELIKLGAQVVPLYLQAASQAALNMLRLRRAREAWVHFLQNELVELELHVLLVRFYNRNYKPTTTRFLVLRCQRLSGRAL